MADQSIDHYNDAFDGPSKDSAWTPKIGDLLAYRINDSNACRLFHIGKVRELSERQAVVDAYATTNPNLRRAKWAPLYLASRGRYSLQRPRKRTRRNDVVQDTLELNEPGETDGLILRRVRLLQAACCQKAM